MKICYIYDQEFLLFEWLRSDFLRAMWIKAKLRDAGVDLDDVNAPLITKRDNQAGCLEIRQFKLGGD